MNRKTYLKKSTIYQIYVRNHTKEGTFLALLSDLPRIKALGVDILYLLPIHPIGEVERKGKLGSPYAIKDYYAINPELGTLSDFKEFLKVAHDLGFKVMIDIVLHHTSPDAVLLKEHPEYYFYKDGKLGNKIGDWSDIVDLDYTEQALWDYMLNMLTYWVKLGVDGFRADVAPMVPLAFWEYVRAALDEVNPSLMWLSESVEPSFLTFLNENNHIGHSDKELYRAFDMLYDYDIYNDLKHYLTQSGALSLYVEGLARQMKDYPPGFLKIRTMENHDTLRIAALCKNEAVLRNVTAWSFFANGVGFLYAGQEVKATYRPDLFNKDVIDFRVNDQAFYDFVKALIAFKKVLNHTEYDHYELLSDGVDGTLSARRMSKDDVVYGFFNFSGKKVRIDVPLEDSDYRNALTGDVVSVKRGKMTVSDPVVIINII